MNGRTEIAILLASVDPPGKTRCKPYRKPQSIKDFETEHMNWYYSGRNVPACVQSITRFRDDSANDLTKLIIAFLKVRGAFATRLNSTGIYRNDLKKFVPNTQRRGMSDIVGTYRGKSINIEVKIGKDRMSDHQIKIRKEIEEAGGYYCIARNFDGFLEWFNKL